MELQPPERHTLVNAAHEGLQEDPEYLEQGWEQQRGQLELNRENNSLLRQVLLTRSSLQLPSQVQESLERAWPFLKTFLVPAGDPRALLSQQAMTELSFQLLSQS